MVENGIPEWYAGRSVLVTGGTGFMGKVLLEKLLRACPDIDKIYVLCRPKRGFLPDTRISEITTQPLFDRLRNERPTALKKLVAVEGDLTAQNLGLSPDMHSKLITDVSVVFNGAAYLRMDWEMKAAVESNVLGTLRVLELAKQMTQLQVLVHLSTTFCHCEYKVVEEIVYPSSTNAHDIIRICQWMDDATLMTITPRLLGQHPNCYTYTKQLAESLVCEFGNDIPCAIARPSIVTPSFREPIPGWVDNLNGPLGLIVASGKGVIRSILCGGDNRAEVVPVDLAINAIIVIAHHCATTKSDLDAPVPAYNLSCGEVEPITWGEIINRGKRFIYEYPYEAGLWYPNLTIRTNRLVHTLIVFFLQVIPAYLIDFLMLLLRRKRFMVRVQTRISNGMKVLEYFTMRDWKFKNDRAKALSDNMNPRDAETFYIANVKYDINEYMMSSVLGARLYCMKDPLSSLPSARRHLRWLFWLDCTTKLVLVLLVAWLLMGWLDAAARSLLDFSETQIQRIPTTKAHVPVSSA